MTALHATVAGWLLGPPSGANRRLLALLDAAAPLLRDGERITVLHAEGFVPPRTVPAITWQPIAIPPRPTLQRARAERHLLAAAITALGANVHEHGFLPLPPLPVPTALLLHDLRAVDGMTRWPRWLAREVLRRSLRRAATVVVPSEWTAGRVRELLPELGERVVVVPNGVALPSASPTPPPPLPPNGFLLHTGHLEARKNLAVVVAALARLPRATRPALWLVGADAGHRTSLEARIAALELGDDVRFCGAVDDATLAALYAAARAVVVPSKHEGFGLPVLEAFAHGTAVLCADATALPEVAAGRATLLPPDDDAAWARAIAALPIAEEPDAPARRSRLAHAAAHDWTSAAQRWLDVLRRTANTPCSPD
ncbi:MAG: glycosyltransferase [Planctomycetota bacterium]